MGDSLSWAAGRRREEWERSPEGRAYAAGLEELRALLARPLRPGATLGDVRFLGGVPAEPPHYDLPRILERLRGLAG
jgi:hypothetical protein